jgi:heat shock protein HslJ
MTLRQAAIVVISIASASPAPGRTASGSSPACCRTPRAQAEGAALEGLSWRLVSLSGQSAADLAALERGVSLRLDQGRVTGFTGCNVMIGTYSTQGLAVTFKLAGTLKACIEPAATIERAFLEALHGRLSHAVTADRLTLTGASGTVLEFERELPGTLGGRTWTVTGYNNGRQAVVTPIADTHLTLSFENGTLSGMAGCNTFHGTFKAQDDHITIDPVAATRKMCAAAVMAQEREFLKALESATRWAVEGGVLEMHRSDGERVLMATPDDLK